jgi:hypothetical protein
MVDRHTPLSQSVGCKHFLPSPQAGHAPPPQSTSVSAPFWKPSVHRGAAHSLLLHCWLKQSVEAMQPFPVPHLRHSVPPQSTPVSSESFVPFVQWLATQVPLTQTGVGPEQAWCIVVVHTEHTRTEEFAGSGFVSQKPIVVPPIAHVGGGVPASAAPPAHVHGMHSLPLSKALVSSSTLPIMPLSSHQFCWQFPYTCDDAGPAVYVTAHFPPAQALIPHDAHGPGGIGFRQSAALWHSGPPVLLVLPLLLPVLPVPPPDPFAKGME